MDQHTTANKEANNTLGLQEKEGKSYLEMLSLFFRKGMIQKRIKMVLVHHFITIVGMSSAEIVHLVLRILLSELMEETKGLSKMPTRRHGIKICIKFSVQMVVVLVYLMK